MRLLGSLRQEITSQPNPSERKVRPTRAPNSRGPKAMGSVTRTAAREGLIKVGVQNMTEIPEQNKYRKTYNDQN